MQMLNISKYQKLIVGCSAIATAVASGFVQSAEAGGQRTNHTAQSSISTTLIAQLNSSNSGGINNSNSGGLNGSNSGGPGIIIKGGAFGDYYFDSNNGRVVTNGGYYFDANGPNGAGYYPYTSQGNAPYYFGKGPLGLGYYSYNVNATSPPAPVNPPGTIVKGGAFGDYYFDSNNGGVVANGGYYFDANGPKGAGYYPYTGQGNAPYYFGKGPQGLGYYSYNVNATSPLVGPPGVFVKGPNGDYYFDSNNGGVVANGGYYFDANGPKGAGYYPYTGQGNAPYYFGKGPNGLGYYSYNVNATTTPTPVGPPGIFVKGPNGPYYFDNNNGSVVNNGGYYFDANGPNGAGYYPYTGNGNAPYYFGKGPQGLGYYSYNVNATNSSDAGAIGSAPTLPGTTVSNGTGSRSGSGYSSRDVAFAGGALSKFNAAMSKYEIAAAALAAAEAGQNNASSSTSPVRYGREPGDIAACGCPNADLNASGTPSKELVAAKAAEAEAAAELAAAKAEARQFLESVKTNGGSNGFSPFQPIW
jgi:hypothetical protein